MNATLQAYLQGPEPLQDSDHTSLQRQALAEVLQLLPAVIEPLEAQIESAYRTTQQQAHERCAADQGRIEAEVQARSREIRRQYDDQIEAVRADYEKQLSVIKVDAHHGRKRAIQKAAELKDTAEKEYRDQIMVAEFVADGAVTRIEQERLAAQAAVQAGRRRLDALAAQADRLLRLYRQPAPPTDQGVESGAGAHENPAEAYHRQQALAEQHLEILARLFTAQLFAGARPLLFGGGLLGVAVTLLSLLYVLRIPPMPPLWVAGPVTVGFVLLLVGVGGRILWRRAKRQIQREFNAFQDALAGARSALDQRYELTLQDLEWQSRTSQEQKEAELRKARNALETAKMRMGQQRNVSLQETDERRRKALDHLRQQRDMDVGEAERQYREQQSALEERHRQDLARVQARYDQEMAACANEHRTARQRLEERWDRGLACIHALLQDTADLAETTVAGWDDLLAESWATPETAPAVVRFGAFALDLRLLTDTVLARAGPASEWTRPVVIPALLEFPRKCSMLLESPREGRPQAIETLRAVMTRLFTSLPPGRVRFTILDPVGLGESFAGFLHTSNCQEAVVGGRIWTEAPQIEQQLNDLAQQIENVIRDHLGNEFETVEQYNQQAAALAEPYRFLVIADFPINFSEEAARHLSSIIHSGPRCGVHTLIAYDTRRELPAGIEDLSVSRIHLVYEDGQYVWQDPVLRHFPLTLGRPPLTRRP